MIDDKIAIGLIRTSHGVKGELKVSSFSGEIEHFFEIQEVFLKDKRGNFLPRKIEKVKIKGDLILMKLEGIDTPEEGKRLNGYEIWVPRSQAAPLNADEYYYADLCQCSLYLENQRIGSVKSVIDGNASELLEVVKDDKKTVLIPFLDRYLSDINIDEKKIFLRDSSLLE